MTLTGVPAVMTPVDTYGLLPAVVTPPVRIRPVRFIDGVFVEEASHNLVPNPSFETDTSGWASIQGATVVASTERSVFGSSCMKVTTNPASTYEIVQSAAMYLLPGQYVVSAYMYLPPSSPTVGALALNINAPGGTIFGSVCTVTGQWQRVITAFTVTTAGPHYVDIQTYVDPIGEVWYVDAVQVEMKPYATSYLDGSLGAGYSWDNAGNLISNPSFETDTAGWTGLGENLLPPNDASFEGGTGTWGPNGLTSATQSADFALNGTYSLKLTCAGAGNDRAANANVPIAGPGALITAIAYFRAAATPRQVAVQIAWFDAANNYMGTDTGQSVMDQVGSWTQAKYITLPPVNAASALIELMVIGAAGGEIHYADCVGLFPTPLIAGGGVNMIDNADFENGLGGWAAEANTTIAQTLADAWTGRASMLVTHASAGGAVSTYQTVNTVAGQTYTISAKVKRVSGTHGVGIAAAATSTFLAGTGSWQTITMTFVATGTSTTIYIYNADALQVGSSVVGDAFYLDAVKLEVGSAATPYVPRQYTNLVMNPSLEVDTNGWGLQGGQPIARITSQSYIGSACLQVTCAALVAGDKVTSSVLTEVDAGVTYTCSAWVKVPVGVNIRIGLENVYQGAVDHVGTGGWMRVSETFTPNATFTNAGILFNIGTGGCPNNTVIYVDAAQIELGRQANPYIDGSLGPGFVWESSSNLLSAQDASFESAGVGSWVPNSNTTLVNTTAAAFSGTHSLSLAAVAAGSVFARTGVGTAGIPVIGGVTYTISAYLRAAATAHSGFLGYQWFDSSGTSISSVNGAAAADNTSSWTRYTYTAVAPANAAYLMVFAEVDGCATGEVHYLDGIQVEQRAYATPFGETGAANASTSRVEIPWGLASQSKIDRSSGAPDGTWSAATITGALPAQLNPNLYAVGFSYKVNVNAGTTYAFSVYTSAWGGCRLMAGGPGLSTPVVGTAYSSDAGAWNRKAIIFTATATGAVYLRVFCPPTLAAFNIDAVQLEARNYVTPYSAAGGPSSTSSRQGGGIEFQPPASKVNTWPATLMATAKVDASIPPSVTGTNPVHVDLGKGDVSRLLRMAMTPDGSIHAYVFANGNVTGYVDVPTAGVPQPGDIISAAATYDGHTLSAYASRNGGPIMTATATHDETSGIADVFAYGYNWYNGGSQTNAAYEQVLAFNTALSAAEVNHMLNGQVADISAEPRLVLAAGVATLPHQESAWAAGVAGYTRRHTERAVQCNVSAIGGVGSQQVPAPPSTATHMAEILGGGESAINAGDKVLLDTSGGSGIGQGQFTVLSVDREAGTDLVYLQATP